MINYYIPCFFEENEIRFTFRFVKYFLDNREYFIDNANIGAIYGSFEKCTWDGGRYTNSIEGSYKIDNVKLLKYLSTELDIPIRFTFSNAYLEEKDLSSRWENALLKEFHSSKNGVILSSDILKNHVKKKFSKYQIISSVTQCHRFNATCRDLNDDSYDMVVVDPYLNFSDKLYDLPNREKIELIINHRCQDDCPLRVTHYKDVCSHNMGKALDHDTQQCDYTRRKFYQCMEQNRSFITKERLNEDLIPKGFVNFKLDGRGNSWDDRLEAYIYFLAKPEYAEGMREELMNSIL